MHASCVSLGLWVYVPEMCQVGSGNPLNKLTPFTVSSRDILAGLFIKAICLKFALFQKENSTNIECPAWLVPGLGHEAFEWLFVFHSSPRPRAPFPRLPHIWVCLANRDRMSTSTDGAILRGVWLFDVKKGPKQSLNDRYKLASHYEEKQIESASSFPLFKFGGM